MWPHADGTPETREAGSPRESAFDGMGTPSFINTARILKSSDFDLVYAGPLTFENFCQEQVLMGTPRTVATGHTSVGAMTQLLDSERRLLLNQQRADMERKDQELKVRTLQTTLRASRKTVILNPRSINLCLQVAA
jgi:hypothetical protein